MGTGSLHLLQVCPASLGPTVCPAVDKLGLSLPCPWPGTDPAWDFPRELCCSTASFSPTKLPRFKDPAQNNDLALPFGKALASGHHLSGDSS